MRLLILSDGSSVHTDRWCRYFEGEGFETALFSLEPCTISGPGKIFAGRRVTGKGLIDYFLAGGNYGKVLKDFKPDIVNPHFIVSYGWLAARYKSCPIVATAWGSDLLILPNRSAVHRLRAELALKAAEFCTVDNRNLLEAAARYIPRDKILMVVMGVERAVFEKAAKREFNKTGPLEIISPRGLDAVYDPETVLKAAAIVRDKMSFKLNIFGRMDEIELWNKKIDDAGLGEIVFMRSFLAHDEFMEQLGRYDLYLSASLSDSTSVALLEAMAVGLFPVVSDIEGNRAWVKDAENGQLFKAGSAEVLAEALLRAAARRDKFEVVAKLNRGRVADEAIWEDNMKKVRDLMLTMVEK